MMSRRFDHPTGPKRRPLTFTTAAAARLVTANLPLMTVASAEGLSLVASELRSAASARAVLIFQPHALAALGTKAPRAGRYEAPIREAELLLASNSPAGALGHGDPSALIDGLALDAMSIGRLLATAAEAAETPARLLMAELLSDPGTAAPAYDDPDSDAAYRWHAERMLRNIMGAGLRSGEMTDEQRRSSSLARVQAVTDLRLVLAPTPKQSKLANRTILPATPNGIDISLLHALLATSRLADMPGGGSGAEWPDSLELMLMNAGLDSGQQAARMILKYLDEWLTAPD